jgi:hypothetical protein
MHQWDLLIKNSSSKAPRYDQTGELTFWSLLYDCDLKFIRLFVAVCLHIYSIFNK